MTACLGHWLENALVDWSPLPCPCPDNRALLASSPLAAWPTEPLKYKVTHEIELSLSKNWIKFLPKLPQDRWLRVYRDECPEGRISWPPFGAESDNSLRKSINEKEKEGKWHNCLTTDKNSNSNEITECNIRWETYGNDVRLIPHTINQNTSEQLHCERERKTYNRGETNFCRWEKSIKGNESRLVRDSLGEKKKKKKKRKEGGCAALLYNNGEWRFNSSLGVRMWPTRDLYNQRQTRKHKQTEKAKEPLLLR